MAPKSRRGTSLLLILQAWIIPCHGFNWISPYRGALSYAAHDHARLGSVSASRTGGHPTPGSIKGTPQLCMSQRSGAFSERFEDDYSSDPEDEKRWSPADAEADELDVSGNPPPYREEHNSGGSMFRDLLTRAKGMEPSIAGKYEDTTSRPSRRPDAAQPGPQPSRSPMPTRYSNSPYNDYQEERIGSPDLPDIPLRNETPGMRLPNEVDYGDDPDDQPRDGADGGRFRQMMEKAKHNDDRMAAGMGPRVGRRPGGDQRSPTITREEKAKAYREAVDRQQKLMAKARGYDLDDPTLDGPTLAKKKAASRAQAEASAGGYVPSTSASDDYIDSLKVDSKRRTAALHDRLSRQGTTYESEEPTAPPPPSRPPSQLTQPTQPTQPPKEDVEYVRQRRTAASFSVQNESDAYIAQLSGIKVDIERNPYLEPDRGVYKEDMMPIPKPSPHPVTGPTMSYAERLQKARRKETPPGEVQASALVSGPPSAPTPAAQAVVPVKEPSAPQDAGPALSYAERLRQARDASKASAVPTPRPAARASASEFREDHVRDELSGGLMDDKPRSPLLVDDDDDPHAKIVEAMNLLTEHKTSGLVGQEKVDQLRKILATSRDALRAETYGPSGPPTAPSRWQPAPEPTAEAVRSSPAPSAAQESISQASQSVMLSAEEVEVLKACGAQLTMYTDTGVASEGLEALREDLVDCLHIVDAHLGDFGLATIEQEPGQRSQEAVPDSVNGVYSVGKVLKDMAVDKMPAKFEPEEESGEARAQGGTQGWVDKSLGEYEKGVATRALGYLLKHRGGKGYGRGRVRGAEAVSMISTLAEVTDILQEEMED